MTGELYAVAFYGAILAIIFFRVKKRSHPSRNVWLNTVVLSVALVAVTMLTALPFIAASELYALPPSKSLVGFIVGAIAGAWVVVWHSLMRRFEMAKN